MRYGTRYVLLACGWVFFGLGFVGLFVPVLPTTPFVLLAAACFLRSSERLHAWLVSHPRFGPQIADYLEGNGLRRNTKVVALLTLWGSVALSVALFIPHIVADVLLLATAAGVTVYILRLPTQSAGEVADDGV
jgi:uncharacterized membrane protein YbaN (DUF454 family)